MRFSLIVPHTQMPCLERSVKNWQFVKKVVIKDNTRILQLMSTSGYSLWKALVLVNAFHEQIQCNVHFFLHLGGECRDSCTPNAWLQHVRLMLCFISRAPVLIMFIV